MPDINELEIYNCLILPKKRKIPQRSRLFSLEPIGIGTPYTESLSSYLCRLAQEHCLTPQKLIMGEIAPLLVGNKYHPEILSKNVSALFGNSDAKPTINGIRNMTQSLVHALEQLTLRQDLKFLSCLTWKGIIKERGLFRQNRAWCSQCLEQWQQEKTTIYEPLIWSFKDVRFCPQHHCRLVDLCPHCNSSLKAIANSLRLGFCSRCKGWLGYYQDDNRVLLIDDFEGNHQIITGIGDLVAITPDLRFPTTLTDLMNKLQLIHFCWERVVSQDLTQLIVLGKIMEQLKITLTQHSNKPLSLTKLLIPVCVHTRISLAQLLSQDLQALGATVFHNLEINYRL